MANISTCLLCRKICPLKKLFISSFLASVCVTVFYWTQSNLGYSPSSYEADHSHTTVRFFPETEILDHHAHVLSTEEKLLQAIDKLPFRVMTPSSFLLEDLYFIPSTHAFVQYNNTVLQEPRISCSSSEFLLILVPSHPKSVSERRAIRETWGSVARRRSWPRKGGGYSVKLLFVLGAVDTSPSTGQQLASQKYHDSVFYTSKADTRSYFVGNNNTSSTAFNLMSSTSNRSKSVINGENVHSSEATKYSFKNIPSIVKSGIQNITKTNLVKSYVFSGKLKQDNKTIKNDSLSFSLNDQSTAKSKVPMLKSHTNLIPEISSFDDIVQFDMLDSYTNLTRKMILALQWVVKSCPTAKFIVKVDPDVFIHVPLITTFLKHYGENNSVYGHIYPNAEVQREGKWAVPNTALPIPKYPIYAAGNSYVLSKDAAVTIIQLAPHFPYVLVEDAFITGILASVGGVNRVHMSGFTKWTESKPDPCDFVNDRRYAGNNFTDYDHRLFWREIVDNGNYRCDR